HLERAYALKDKLSIRERLLVEAGHAQVVRGDSEAALTAYGALLEQYPNEPTAINNAGVQASILGRIEEAVDFYRRAIALGTAPALSYTNLVGALINKGDVAAADTALGLFAERFPEARNLPVYRSNLALARSDFAGAAAAAQPLLSGPPELQATANFRLALVAEIEGRRREAERLDRQARTINARRLGWSADELALSEGISAMGRSFDYQPTDPREVERLWVLNQRVTSGRPAPARNYNFFADAFTRAGQPARARAVIEEFRKGMAAIERPLSFDQAMLMVGDALVTAAEGRPADGLQLFRQGCDLIRSRYALCNAHPDEARLYQQAGATDSAVAVLERYFALEAFRAGLVAQYAADLRRLGELYEAKGERAKAIEAYGKFVDVWKNADPELQPMVKDARERMARLSRQEG
ncbi:MAG TPA: tetratricopeptide repeat protein, partial [Gemmatimonadales bacterium]